MKLLQAKTFESIFLLVLLTASGGTNIYQAHKIKMLQEVIQAQRTGENHIGMRVPDIVGKTPEGEPIQINFAAAQQPTVLYIFTPQCEWCRRNFQNMRTLHHSISDHYVFVGISLTPVGITDYVQRKTIDYPVVVETAQSFRDSFQVQGTPTTIVISPDNKMLKIWKGAYRGAVLKDLEAYFGIELPGLIPNEE